jgi:hypothetical protein
MFYLTTDRKISTVALDGEITQTFFGRHKSRAG